MDSTSLIVLLGGALFVLFVVYVILLAISRSSTPGLQVEAKRLMTERERRVLEMIEAAVPGCRVHAQVAMAAIVTHKKSVSHKDRTAIRNTFDRKYVDYVIEHRGTGDIVSIVELDDRTHNAAKDAARDRLASAAGYTIVRLPAGQRITPEYVRERLGSVVPKH